MSNLSIPAGRQQQIYELLKKKGVVHINELAETCEVSKATIRRDLDELAALGNVRRTHGGALLRSKTTFEPTHSEKQALMVEQKQRIAEATAKLVVDGNSVFLDSGTTVLMVARQLARRKNLTVVTNNTEIVEYVDFDATTTLVVTGGIKRAGYAVLSGPITEEFIRNINVDIAILGVDAIDSGSGAYSVALEESGVKREAARCGAQTVLVTDSSKFSVSGIIKIYGFNDVDVIVTDNEILDEDRQLLSEQNLELIIV